MKDRRDKISRSLLGLVLLSLLSFGSGFMVQGLGGGFAAFLLGRCPEVTFKSPVTPTIRGKGSSHMCGMRSFGSVLTCSGWGFSPMGRFRPLRMTIQGSGKALIREKCCVFCN